mgnify:CR=1 FL=1
MPQPYGSKPSSADTAKTLNTIGWIIAIIVAIIWLVVGVAAAGAAAAVPIVAAAGAAAAGILIIFAIVDIVLVIQVRKVNGMIDQGRYEDAKRAELPWVIVGFIFGGIIIGILLLIAYMKLGDAVDWARLYRQSGPPSSPSSA